MIKTAVIGAGDVGREHLAACRANPLCDVVAVCAAGEPLPTEALPESIQSFAELNEMLAEAPPQLCSVTTPLPRRAADVEACLKAGSGVIALLPIAESIDEVRRLVALAREAGLVLAGSYHYRANPAVDTALGWLREGALGMPLFVNMNLWDGSAPTSREDLFLRIGAHGTDMMRAFCGDVARVQCFEATQPEPEDEAAVPSAQINMFFGKGIVGNLTICTGLTTQHPFSRFEMAGTRGRLLVENVYEEATLFIHAEQEKRVITNSIFGGVPQLSSTHAIGIGRVLSRMDAGSPGPDENGEGVLKAHAAMVAAMKAGETGGIVDVEVDPC